MVVIGREFMKHGYCDLCIDKIAAFAGVGRTTVQNALRKAKAGEPGKNCAAYLSIEERPRPGMKNLSNVIRIISKDWLDWLKRRIGFKKAGTTLKPTARNSLKECADTLMRAYEASQAAPSRIYQASANAVGSIDRIKWRGHCFASFVHTLVRGERYG